MSENEVWDVYVCSGTGLCFFPFTVLFLINVCSETIHSSHSIFLVCKPQPSAAFLIASGDENRTGKG
ncbi:hypothetical protein C1I60_13725 [Paenibacillus terrae]|uniref:Uncharacterized protein n=1 Tax=Paenibacillus terrae TaxID=159743 RepID=A0A4U2PZQ8_9BACL|nr:hypothetical protein C1I60_13725 [Paenibacillus terrae]